MPHSEAGWRIEPPVSVPIAHGARPAATAAALPPLEPPGTRVAVPRVLRPGPKPEFSFDEPIANSSWLVLPSTAAPASCEVAHAGGGVGRPVALEDARAGRAGHALDAEQVLDRHRRQRRPGRAGRLLGHPQVGAEVVAGGALALELEQLGGATPRRRAIRSRLLRGGEAEQVAHEPPGLGTRKPPSATSGAPRAPARAAGSGAARPRAARSRARPRARWARRPSRSSSSIFSTWSRIVDSSPGMRSTSSSVSRRRASRATWSTWSRSIIGPRL